eukprot:9272892-Alexandrium_andersonii.AAC.1
MLEAARSCCRPLAALLHVRRYTLGAGRASSASDPRGAFGSYTQDLACASRSFFPAAHRPF